MEDGDSGEFPVEDMPTKSRIRGLCGIVDENMRRLGAAHKERLAFDISAPLSNTFARLTIEHNPEASGSTEASVTLETPEKPLPVISVFGNTYAFWTATQLWQAGDDAGATVTVYVRRVEPEAQQEPIDATDGLWDLGSPDAPPRPKAIDVYTLDSFTLIGAMLEDPTAGLNKAIRTARRVLPDLVGDDIIEIE